MNCPTDGTQLSMTDRQGIEIDFCPQCRGIWLDRGELDKIIERSLGETSNTNDKPDSQYYKGQGHHGKRKHKGFLGELFDF
jgi:Zn-finger nucleic acid-binding protein